MRITSRTVIFHRASSCIRIVLLSVSLASTISLASRVFAAASPAFDDTSWFSLDPVIAGADGPVFGSVLDSSGNLYICGPFKAVGDVVASSIAKWDGSRWSPLGSGVNGIVSALAVSGNEVYAAGAFTTAGGLPATNIAKWNGTSWSAVGTGLGNTDSFVTALAASGSDVYAAVGSTAPNSLNYQIFKWDGTSWTNLGPGLNGEVDALAVAGSDLYAGGNFISIVGGSLVQRIAKWDGTSWSGLTSASPPNGTGVNSPVFALLVSGTDLYVGGSFFTAGGIPANGVAKWDGTNWSAVGSGVAGSIATVNALALSGGLLYAGGQFKTAEGVAANYIAAWDGTKWMPVGSGTEDAVLTLAAGGAALYAGGLFYEAGGNIARHIARWNGNNWSAMSPGWGGRPPSVRTVAARGTNVYVGGSFLIPTTEGIVTNLAQRVGTSWGPIDSGVNGSVSVLAASDGALFVGGAFTAAGGVQASNIAKWDGNTWSALSSGLNGAVSALALSGSDLYAGGTFTTAGAVSASNVAKWDGSWTPLGPGLPGSVAALAVTSNNVYAAAGSVILPNVVFRWDGNTWTSLGSVGGNVDFPFISSLAVIGNDLYVAGLFTEVDGVPASNIAKWNGTSWSALSSGTQGNGGVSALAVFGDSLFAGGQFSSAGGVPANNVARWNGDSWSPLGSGTAGYFSRVNALAVFGSDLYAGGIFSIAGNKVSGYIARASLAAVGESPMANFTVNQIPGPPPRRVQFIDTSTGDISSWLWDFGDGSPDSMQQNPLHRYKRPGQYTVTLRVTGSSGSSTKSLLISLTPGNPHGASYTATADSLR